MAVGDGMRGRRGGAKGLKRDYGDKGKNGDNSHNGGSLVWVARGARLSAPRDLGYFADEVGVLAKVVWFAGRK